MRFSLLPLLALGLALPATAGAERFERPAEGFSFELAGGFFLGGEQNGLILFGSNTTPGLVIAMPSPGLTEGDLDEAARSGYHDEGVSLQPRGEGRALKLPHGKGLVLEVEGMLDGARVVGLLSGYVGDQGQGLVLLSATTPEQWENLRETARAIAESVAFAKVDAGPKVAQWKGWLTGMKLTYMHTSGDYSGGMHDEEHFWLCSDGSFQFQDASNMSFDIDAGFGYSHGGGSGAGTWNVVPAGAEAAVLFTFSDGSTRRHVLTTDGQKTFLDGTRYFLVENDLCP